MNLAGMSTPGLLKLYGAVRETLEIDDALHLAGLPKVHGVRDFPDWRVWSDALAVELENRGIKYQKVDW